MSAAPKFNPSLPEYLQLGLTLPAMREIYSRLPPNAIEEVNSTIPLKNGKPKYQTNNVVNGYVFQYYIEIWGKEDGLSICERLSKGKWASHINRADIFISWALSSDFSCLLDAVDLYLETNPELNPDKTFFCIFDFVTRYVNLKSDLKRLGDIIENTPKTVLLIEPWNAPLPLKRAHCIEEIYHTKKASRKLEFMMSHKQQTFFENALANDFESVVQSMSNIDIRNAECRHEEEKIEILAKIEKLVGVRTCNQMVISLLREVMTHYGRDALAKLQPEKRALSGVIVNVALLNSSVGKYDESFALLTEAIAGREKTLGEKHKDTLVARENLAMHFMNQGKYADALPIFRDVLEGYQTTTGDENESTLNAMNNLALVLEKQGKFDEAMPLFEKTIEHSRVILGDRHDETLTAIRNFSALLIDSGQLKKARIFCTEACDGFKEIHGHRHPKTLQALHDWGVLLFKESRFEDSLEMLKRSQSGRKQVLGDDHPDTKESDLWLEKLETHEEFCLMKFR